MATAMVPTMVALVLLVLLAAPAVHCTSRLYTARYEPLAPPAGPNPGGNGDGPFKASKPRNGELPPPAGPNTGHDGSSEFGVGKPEAVVPSSSDAGVTVEFRTAPAGPDPIHNFHEDEAAAAPPPPSGLRFHMVPSGPDPLHHSDQELQAGPMNRKFSAPPAGPNPDHN